MTNLKNEFDYYLSNQPEMVELYEGKVIVIKGKKVVGVFDDELSAIAESEKEYEGGSFLVQRVSSGDKDYSQTFHSRVSFA
jgi:hypothetical protein